MRGRGASTAARCSRGRRVEAEKRRPAALRGRDRPSEPAPPKEAAPVYVSPYHRNGGPRVHPTLEQQVRAWGRELAQDIWTATGGDVDQLTDAWRQMGVERLERALCRALTAEERRIYLHEAANRLQGFVALSMVP